MSNDRIPIVAQIRNALMKGISGEAPRTVRPVRAHTLRGAGVAAAAFAIVLLGGLGSWALVTAVTPESTTDMTIPELASPPQPEPEQEPGHASVDHHPDFSDVRPVVAWARCAHRHLRERLAALPDDPLAWAHHDFGFDPVHNCGEPPPRPASDLPPADRDLEAMKRWLRCVREHMGDRPHVDFDPVEGCGEPPFPIDLPRPRPTDHDVELDVDVAPLRRWAHCVETHVREQLHQAPSTDAVPDLDPTGACGEPPTDHLDLPDFHDPEAVRTWLSRFTDRPLRPEIDPGLHEHMDHVREEVDRVLDGLTELLPEELKSRP